MVGKKINLSEKEEIVKEDIWLKLAYKTELGEHLCTKWIRLDIEVRS